jgi:adenine-specific DNA-methyltransferase
MKIFDEIKDKLGKPYYENNDGLIFCTNCLTSMKTINEKEIALTITSPPYNIGKAYEAPLKIKDYIDWCKSWIDEVYRITKNNGSFWLNVGYLELEGKAKALPITYLLWDKIKFYLIQEIIWNYGAGVAGRKFFSPRNEKILWYVKNKDDYIFNLDDIRDKNVKYPNQKKNGKLKCNPLGKNPTDVWQIAKVTSGTNRSSKERTPHPAQFPITMIDRIIKAGSNEGDLILDPFIGSGTTALAAMKNNRKFIGFEISKDYCKIAADRIEKYKTKPKQEDLFSGINNGEFIAINIGTQI